MNSKSLVKRELLRRKIKEHWEKNPNANSLIVKANFDGIKTFWHVVKEGNAHRVVEVDTKKEVYLIGEVGWPYVTNEQEEDPKDKGKIKKKDKEEKGPQKDKKPQNIKKPVLPDVKPAGEMGDDPEDTEVGLDKQAKPVPPGEMGAEEDVPPSSPEGPETKTGQELELQRIVHKKPLLGVEVNTDEQGGHLTLKFPGEGNDVIIDVFKDGKVVYTHKDRPRMLKTGITSKPSDQI